MFWSRLPQRGLIGLLRRVREELPEKTIWMFTGFTYERDLRPGGCRYTEVTDELLDAIDVTESTASRLSFMFGTST